MLIIFLQLLLTSGIFCAEASTFEERLKKLEGIVTKQEVEMDILKNENVELKERIQELELAVSRMTNNNELYDLETDSKVDNTELGDSLHQASDLKDKKENGSLTPYRNLKQNVPSLFKRAVTQKVAFHVYLSSSKCFQSYQMIKYDMIALDTRNGYDANVGIYVVPESGMYVFTWTFAADYSEYAVTEIVINGVKKSWTISDGSSQRILLNPTSGLIIAHVNEGSHVYIRRAAASGCIAYSSTFMRPTFSGWQLSP